MIWKSLYTLCVLKLVFRLINFVGDAQGTFNNNNNNNNINTIVPYQQISKLHIYLLISIYLCFYKAALRAEILQQVLYMLYMSTSFLF